MTYFRFTLLSAVTAIGLSSCGSTAIPTPPIQDRKPSSGPPDYHFDEDLPDTLELEQGYEEQVELLTAAHVPSPGAPVITVENMPEGAKFDGKIFSWTPPCGRTALPFQRGLAEFKIKFTLKSDQDPVQFVQRRMNLRVYPFIEGPGRVCGDPIWRTNTPGSALTGPGVYFDQNFPETVGFFQGKSNAANFLQSAHTVPTGNSAVSVKNLPAGASFDGVRLTWTPSCSDDLGLYSQGKRTVPVTVTLTNKDNQTQSVSRVTNLIVYQSKSCAKKP